MKGSSFFNWPSSAACSVYCIKKLQFCFSKGQLISKCLYQINVWTKIPTKILIVSALALSGQKLSNFFVGIVVETMTPNRHFEIN